MNVDRTQEIEAENSRMKAFTRAELAGDLQEDRIKVVEAVLFLAQEMGQTGSYGEYGPHVADLARVVLSMERIADEIERTDERQAFARRALAQEIGRTA